MKIVFLFYDGMTALDSIGPHEILCRLPGAQVQRVALNRGLVKCDSGLMMTTDNALADVSHADLLLVPGAGSAKSFCECPEILDWLRRVHTTTTWTTSVCTGSLILGAAGLLVGLRSTTHWAALDRLQRFGALPTRARFVEDGKVITAAGVSAGIDMALMLADKIAGSQVAEGLQLAIEYDPEPPFDVGSPEKANPAIREALRARMLAAFESLD